eukprot:Lankesteria_metandrocarpae@DN1708_c0_g1_i3.p1
MHYGSGFFAKGSVSTMLPKDEAYMRHINSRLDSPTMCDFYGLNTMYGGYNTDIPCKPSVFVEYCRATSSCVQVDCADYCRWSCGAGMNSGQCEYLYTSAELEKLIDTQSGSDNIFRYSAYDLIAEEPIDWNTEVATSTYSAIGHGCAAGNLALWVPT